MSGSRSPASTRPATRATPKAAARAGWGRRLARGAGAVALRRPIPVLLGIFVTACGGAIGWNALHQSGRHPAPLFAPSKPGSETARAPVPEAPRRFEAAMPAPPPVAAAPAPLPVRRPDPASLPAATPPADVTRTASTDPIGSLIRTGSVAADAAKPAERDKVASAQKALTKLGYGPLKADGVLGSTTRQAVEKFERDKNLPVTGHVGGRTARQLAALSGVVIE